MSLIIIISIAMVLLGIVLMSASISGGFRLNHDLPLELKARWQLMTAFMIFFDVGYIVFVFLLFSEIYFPIEFLIGLILFGGAVFVFMFIKQTEFTVRRMNELQHSEAIANEKLRESNVKLIEEVREREKISAELRKSKTNLENVFNNSIPLCLTSTDFEIVDANDAYYRIFGRPEAAVVKQKCYDSRIGPTCHGENCLLTRIMDGESEVLCESEKINSDGVKQRFLVTARPLRDENGNIAGIVESFQDITRLKMAENALAEEKERLLVTLGSIADGVIAVDPEGRVALTNDRAQVLTGWSKEESVGGNLAEIMCLVETRDRRKKIDLMSILMHFRQNREGKVPGAEGRAVLVGKDGWERHVNYSVSPILNDNTDFLGGVLVFQDITEQLKVEQETARIEKLESVSLLASGVAHDFNNILTAIMNNLTLARLVKDSNDKLLEKLDASEEAVVKAKELTSQLLTFAKGGSIAKEMVSIGDLVKNSVGFCLRGSNVSGDLSIDDGLWPVEVDEVQVHQVISNLVINADQAMPDGGVLSVLLTNCLVRPGDSALVEEGRYVRLIVKDQGPGISEENLTKIFDPYFTTKPEGSGLGLATVYSIISKHDGYVFVDSKEGEGTAFTIYLPAAQEEGMSVDVAGSIAANGGQIEKPSLAGGRILIMDDEEDIRELLGELLHSAGFKVISAGDGEEAIRYYRKAMEEGKSFDCVIMDLTVPGGMGGREAISKFLEIDPDVKAIVSSGYANDPVMADYEKYGFLGRVAKPYKLEVLLETINEIVDDKPSS